MKALVTGATGYVGARLAAGLAAEGWEVHAVVRAESASDDLRARLGAERVHVHDGTTAGMLALVGRAQPTTVFHLASLYLAQHTTADVSRLIESNVHFPAQLAEAMAVHGVARIVNTGTVWQHYEGRDFNPVNLYAATKQACVDVLRFYADSGAFRVLNLELFDTYGPGDPRPKLFSMLRKASASGESLKMSPGEQLIDLVYIDDVVSAFRLAAKRAAEPNDARMETFSVSTQSPIRLRELVELWKKTVNRRVTVEWGARPYRPREMMHPWDGGARLPAWNSTVPLEQGIRLMEGLP